MQKLLTAPNLTNIAYDPSNGALYRVNTEDNNISIIRRLLPDEDGYIFCSTTEGKQVKRKAHNLCWYIANGDIPEGYFVLQVLQDNLRLDNLKLVTKEEYLKYKDAEYNLSNNILIVPEPKHTFAVKYMDKGKVISAKGFSYKDALVVRQYILQKSREEIDRYFA